MPLPETNRSSQKATPLPTIDLHGAVRFREGNPTIRCVDWELRKQESNGWKMANS